MKYNNKRTITVEVIKTVQTSQYEPVQIRVSETVVVDDASSSKDSREIHADLYKGVTKSVKSFIDNELTKYSKEEKRIKG